MQLTDGTTTLTFSGTQVNDFLNIDKNQSVSAGGQVRSQVSGARYIVREAIRVTGDELQSLITLLTNQSDYYYYTPSTVPDYMSASDFPLRCDISAPSKIRHVGGGTKRYYCEISVESVDYI